MSSPSEYTSVTLLNLTEDNYMEMLEWLQDSHIQHLCFVSPSDKYTNHHRVYTRGMSRLDCVFRFEHADQAMLFKLAWHS